MPRNLAIAWCLILLGGSLKAQKFSGEASFVPSLDLPVPAADKSFRELRDCRDLALEARLLDRVRSDPLRRMAVERKKLGVALVDLWDPRRPRLATIHPDHMLYAASLPKLGLLWAAYAKLDSGELSMDPALAKDLDAMIRVSSNAAATRVLDRLSFQGVEEALRAPPAKLYDPDRGGGIWVGKRFAKKGPRIGDPLANLSHAASPIQVARLYYRIALGRAFSREASRAMLGHLSRPGLNHSFVGELRRRAPEARLYRKSGTWSRWCSDSVLVWGPRRRYILVGLAEDGVHAKGWIRSLVGLAEEALEMGKPRNSALLGGHPASIPPTSEAKTP